MTYQLDTSGTLVANYINGETHTVNPSVLSSFGLLFLSAGPFFGGNLVVRYSPAAGGATTTLLLGTDYNLSLQLVGFGHDTNTRVFGAIALFNTNLNGVITVSYQALGGNWTYDSAQIANYLNTNPYDANLQYVVLTPSPAIYIPISAATPFPLNSVVAVQQAQSALSTISLGVTYYPIGSMAPSVDAINAGQSQLVTILNQLVALLSTAPLRAGTNHIGSVSIDDTTNPLAVNIVSGLLPSAVNLNWRTSSASPIVTPSTVYPAGSLVGGLMEFAMGSINYSGYLDSIRIKATSIQTTKYTLYLFSQRPVNTTWTDRTAPVIDARDLPYLIGSWTTTGFDNGLGVMTLNQLRNIGAPITAVGPSLFGVLVCSDTPEYTTAADLSVAISFK